MPRKGPSTIEERLHRIEGQIRGIERMVTEESSDEAVVNQLQAVISSLESVKRGIVVKSLRESVNQDIDKAINLLK